MGETFEKHTTFMPGTYHTSAEKKYDPLIVFIHCFGGVPEQLKYHIDFLNEAGFDAYTYPAFLNGQNHWRDFVKQTNELKNNVIEIWTQELEHHLNQLGTRRSKVIFSFSLPSAAAFMVSVQRKDIVAIICDGGPFVQILPISWRYLTYYQKIKNPLLKVYLTAIMALVFQASSIKKHLTKALKQLPKDYPVLNFQALKDQQVPSQFIEDTLKPAGHINLQICGLKGADHLEGLKKNPELYTKTTLQFLKQVSST